MYGFEWLTASVIYIALSSIIAILIGFEGRILRKNNGKIPKTPVFHISSLLDTIWFFVSVSVIFMLDMPSLALSVPIAYTLYSIGGWIYSSRMLRQGGVPSSLDELVIPTAYIAYSQAFALVFFGLCLAVLTSLLSAIL